MGWKRAIDFSVSCAPKKNCAEAGSFLREVSKIDEWLMRSHPKSGLKQVMPGLCQTLGLWAALVLLSLVVLLPLLEGAVAQEQGETAPPTLSELLTENPDQVLARLSDGEIRQVLLEYLNENAASEPAERFNPANIAFALQDGFGRIRDRSAEVFGAAPQLPGVFVTSFQRIVGEQSAGQFGAFILIFLISLGVAYAVERLIRRQLKTVGLEDLPARQRFGGKVLVLVRRYLLELAYIFLFCCVSATIYFLAGSDYASFRATFVFYLAATAITRAAIAGTTVFYAPKAPGLRLPSLSDADALRLKQALNITVALGAFGFFTCALFAVHGVVGHAHELVLIIVGTVTITALVTSVLLNRAAITNDILSTGGEPSQARMIVAKVYPVLVSAVFVLMWIGVVASAFLGLVPLYGAALTTIFTLLVLPSLDAAMEREANLCLGDGAELTAALGRSGRIALLVLAIVVLAIAWRIQLFDVTGGGISTQIAHGLLQAGATLAVAYILWQAARIWIDRKIREEEEEFAKQAGQDLGEMEIGGAGQSRLRTLLPLIKRSIQITLAIVTVMFVMSSLGVDIGPLLAGAGVVGLAVGFGSQTLVRDVVSGLFFLLDDAFRLGEYVDVGDVRGSVEKISIRSFQLRHHRGALNTIPFGEISVLQNFSRDWAIMKLRFRVPFDTDLEKVRKIMKTVGRELMENPAISDDFLQPLKSQGVLEVDDYGLVVRAKFMSKPGKQFLIRRYAYMAVQQAFADNGIDFAKPEVRVVVDDDEEEDATVRKAAEVGGAAAQSIASKPPQAGAAE